MYKRPSNESVTTTLRGAESLVLPGLIGAAWFAIAIASLMQFNEMGRTLAEARAAQERATEVDTSATAACRHVSESTIRTN